MKQTLRAATKQPGSLQATLANFLLAYQNTAHAMTKQLAARLSLGHDHQASLDLLKPDLRREAVNKQIDQAKDHEHSSIRKLQMGQCFLA